MIDLIPMIKFRPFTPLFLSLVLCACDGASSQNDLAFESSSGADVARAAVTAVAVAGESGNYSFSVTVESDETGCAQYADWWEVITPTGELIYRRILAHSHVTEQPFTRSGGPVNVQGNEELIVRAHMNSVGYGSQIFSGSVDGGFVPSSLDSSFSEELEVADPLPDSCAF